MYHLINRSIKNRKHLDSYVFAYDRQKKKIDDFNPVNFGRNDESLMKKRFYILSKLGQILIILNTIKLN